MQVMQAMTKDRKMVQNRKCGIYKKYPETQYDTEGGLRVKGQYKENTDEYPLVTYITVAYNSENTIMSCMESIWHQDYPNIEYIIIDGNSTDGTKQVLKENEDKIDYYISQPDTGIYNAMNKGVSLASGQLICFMNSDDQCMPGAASKVVEIYRRTKADVICGSRELVQSGKRVYEVKYPRYCIRKSVFRYVQMFHQSTYVTPEVFEEIGYFDEAYSVLADWVWESKCIDCGFKIHFLNEELARFNYGGISNQAMFKRDNEWEEWTQKTFPCLNKKNAKFFIYCLDRGRHPLFDLKMLNQVAFQYFEDAEFRNTYYATVLLACMEQCTDIALMGKGRETYIDKEISTFRLKELFHVNNLQDIVEWLDLELRETYEMQADKKITKVKMEELVPLRRCLNKIFYFLYMTREQTEDASRLDRLLRIMYYTVSKLVSKNVLFSRKFYITLRAVWYYSFKGKFVEN